MGLVGGGAHAEYLVVDQRETLAAPAGLDFPAAAAIPEAFLTAWDALATRARVRPGERVLVHAVGSGVGTAAVQLALWLGATPIGTSRSAEKLDRARALGMAAGIDTSAGWSAAALERPVDVILDCLGGGGFAENLVALAPRGRLVLLGTLQGGSAAGVDLARILRFRLEVIGTVMRSRGLGERVELAEQFTSRVLADFGPRDRGAPRLAPVVGATFSMSEVRRAHEAMEANAVFGKIVLTWED
jgi:NADPH:quinone reductase-like Zn-dependent oxidoreductase